MKMQLFFFLIVIGVCSGCGSADAANAQSATVSVSGKYQCLPCGRDCDGKRYDKPGECPDCHMKLVEVASVGFGTVDPAKICEYIQSHPGLILLDVRTKAEFEGKANPDFGTLKNAINIPVQELDQRMAELSAFKDKEVLVYCSHSHRSPQASYMLVQNGFKHVVNMAGGMSVVKGGDCLK